MATIPKLTAITISYVTLERYRAARSAFVSSTTEL